MRPLLPHTRLPPSTDSKALTIHPDSRLSTAARASALVWEMIKLPVSSKYILN
ncbi:MAG: hypothetical protein M5U34_11130 [Chloroflexi bacterium]|nr:hypothetical protein [Chloroflexota bacterium]